MKDSLLSKPLKLKAHKTGQNVLSMQSKLMRSITCCRRLVGQIPLIGLTPLIKNVSVEKIAVEY